MSCAHMTTNVQKNGTRRLLGAKTQKYYKRHMQQFHKRVQADPCATTTINGYYWYYATSKTQACHLVTKVAKYKHDLDL